MLASPVASRAQRRPGVAPFPAATPLTPACFAVLPLDAGFAAWQVLRAVELWAAEPEERRGELFDRAALYAWEGRLLESSLEAELRFPLAVIVRELAEGGPAGRVPWACVCLADWALGHGARTAALALAEAAARVAPTHPRYAWLAGRLQRAHGEPRAAERWLRRALRLALAQRDWETQARALSALGGLSHEGGRGADARALHTRALRISRRWRLRDSEAVALLDLIRLADEAGDHPAAERLAGEALEVCRPLPARLQQLGRVVCRGWLAQGHCGRAASVLRALGRHPQLPAEALGLACAMARAAAGCADRAGFEAAWGEAARLAPRVDDADADPAAQLELAEAATALADWSRASGAALEAERLAGVRGDTASLTRARALLGAIAARCSEPFPPPRRGASTSAGERLAAALAGALDALPAPAQPAAP